MRRAPGLCLILSRKPGTTGNREIQDIANRSQPGSAGSPVVTICLPPDGGKQMVPKLFRFLFGYLLAVSVFINPAIGWGWQAGAFHALRNLTVRAGLLINFDVCAFGGMPEEKCGFKYLPEHRFPSYRSLEHNALPISYRKFQQIVEIGGPAVWITPEFFSTGRVKRPPLNFSSRVQRNIRSNNIYVSQQGIAFHLNPFGGGLSGVFNVDVNSAAKGLGVHICPFDGEVSPGLGAPHIACHLDRLFGSLGGSPASLQSSPNENHSGRSDEHFRQSDPEHSLGPSRHILLGLQVILGLLFFCGGWLLIVRGFERAGDALDVVLDGNRKAWLRVGFWFGMSLIGAGLSAGVVTYALSVCSAC